MLKGGIVYVNARGIKDCGLLQNQILKKIRGDESMAFMNNYDPKMAFELQNYNFDLNLFEKILNEMSSNEGSKDFLFFLDDVDLIIKYKHK